MVSVCFVVLSCIINNIKLYISGSFESYGSNNHMMAVMDSLNNNGKYIVSIHEELLIRANVNEITFGTCFIWNVVFWCQESYNAAGNASSNQFWHSFFNTLCYSWLDNYSYIHFLPNVMWNMKIDHEFVARVTTFQSLIYRQINDWELVNSNAFLNLSYERIDKNLYASGDHLSWQNNIDRIVDMKL